ncbi:MAG: glycosyltransferase family 2 protein [Acidimicrobiales bacterium]|nr:glycosyltransferase family 2 protein [Acidimicrobiales bacterium]
MTVSDAPSTGDVRSRPAADVSVIICAYTLDRWELLGAAIDSVLEQSVVPRELFLSIDHNDELLERCREQWGGAAGAGEVPIRIVANAYDGHLGSARTTAAEMAVGEYIAFLDDDAAAEPDWLERMLKPFEDPGVIAVGGCPLPNFSVPRPGWFPPEYDWVFGCFYVGLPTTTAPIRHVIGAAMAVRRADLAAIGYFHSDNHDDMDMCHRLLDKEPDSQILFEPSAVVRHYVHPNRLTWSYFWRRCFWVNRGKVAAFRQMGEARNLTAERRFARQALTRGVSRGTRELLHGDVSGGSRAAVICIGLALAGSGYAYGSLEWAVTSRRRRRAGAGAATG